MGLCPVHDFNSLAGCTVSAVAHTDEAAANRMLSLPMFPELTEEQISRVADEIKGFFAGNG